MKKKLLIGMLGLSMLLGGCTSKTETVTPYIENDDVTVVDYTKLDFKKTTPYEATESDIDNYITYLLESYEKETGEDLGEDKHLTSEVIYWLTEDESVDENGLRELIKDTLNNYYIKQSKSENLNEIYALIAENSTLKHYTKEQLKQQEDIEIAYIESAAKMNDMDLEDYKSNILGIDTSTDGAYEQYIEDSAVATLKSDKIIEAIAEKEGVSISDEEYQEYVANAVSYYGYESEEELLDVYSEEQMKNDMLYNKVLDVIYNMYPDQVTTEDTANSTVQVDSEDTKNTEDINTSDATEEQATSTPDIVEDNTYTK